MVTLAEVHEALDQTHQWDVKYPKVRVLPRLTEIKLTPKENTFFKENIFSVDTLLSNWRVITLNVGINQSELTIIENQIERFSLYVK